jgi:hypothetical protein
VIGLKPGFIIYRATKYKNKPIIIHRVSLRYTTVLLQDVLSRLVFSSKTTATGRGEAPKRNSIGWNERKSYELKNWIE